MRYVVACPLPYGNIVYVLKFEGDVLTEIAVKTGLIEVAVSDEHIGLVLGHESYYTGLYASGVLHVVEEAIKNRVPDIPFSRLRDIINDVEKGVANDVFGQVINTLLDSIQLLLKYRPCIIETYEDEEEEDE